MPRKNRSPLVGSGAATDVHAEAFCVPVKSSKAIFSSCRQSDLLIADISINQFCGRLRGLGRFFGAPKTLPLMGLCGTPLPLF